MHPTTTSGGRLSRAFSYTFAAGIAAALLFLAQPAAAAGTVTGTITRPDGTTVISDYSNLTLRTANWTYSVSTTANSNGTFTFSNVPAGTFKLEIWSSNTSYFPPNALDVTITDDQTTALGAIRFLDPNFFCKVVKSDGTTPVANASISVHTNDWSISRNMNTDSSGNCKTALTVSGAYVIETWAWDTLETRPDNVSFTYSSGSVYYDGTNGSTPLTLIPSAIRGRLLIPGGTAAQSAYMTLYNANNVGVQWSSTDNDGYFKIDAVPSGTYRLHINPPTSPTGLRSPDDLTFTLTKGTTDTAYLAAPITLAQSVKTISGRVTRKNTGSAVSDAYISFWQPAGGGWGSTTTNSNGEYSMLVSSGGTWEMTVYPTYTYGVSPDWTYDGVPMRITFALANDQTESKTADFAVTSYTATLQGTITDPNGNPVNGSTGYYSVNAWKESGSGGNWSQVGASGTYTMKLVPGTFKVSIYGSELYGSTEYTITIAEGETYTLNARLLAKNATLRGTVRDTNNLVVPNQWCSAWLAEGGNGWGSGTTDSTGVFSINVTAGTWYVNCYAYGVTTSGTSTVNYVSTDPPQKVTVAENGTVGVDFTFGIANSTMSGKLVDENNAAITSIYGWVQAEKCSSTTPATYRYYGLGGTISNGTFSLSVPEGCWRLGASVGYGSDYSTSTASTVEVTVVSNEARNNIDLKLIPNNATASGSIKDGSGNVLTGVYGSVYLTNGFSHQWAPITEGTYSLKVSAGTWQFGCWVDYATSSQYYMAGVCEGDVTTTANATTTRDIALLLADSAIAVRAIDPSGNALPNVRVEVSTSFGSAKTVSYAHYGSWFNPDKHTDQNGNASFTVPGGTYFVTASLPPELGYLNPERQVITVSADTPAEIIMTFQRPDATLTVAVTKDGAAYTDGATVTAWSADGGYTESTTDADGVATLGVTKDDEWKVRAGADATATTGYEADEIAVDIPESGAASTNLALTDTVAMPEPTAATFSSNSQQTMAVGDVTVEAPANSLAADNVNVVLSVAPTVADAPNVATDTHVGPAYDISATTASGNNAGTPITELSKNITVCLPYTDAQLTDAGLEEDDLTVKTWTSGTYADVQAVVVNDAQNEVCATTNHLTKFVITSAPVERTSTTTNPDGTDGTQIITPDNIVLEEKQLAVLSSGAAPVVSIFGADGTLSVRFKPFGPKAAGTFRMLAADIISGDSTGGEELVVYETSGRGLPVRIFSLAGKELGKFSTGKGFRARVTTADFDGDGLAELVLAAPGSQLVAIYDVVKGKFTRRLGLTGATAGSEVLAGDLDGAKGDELVLAPYGGKTLSVYRIDLTKKKATKAAMAKNLSLRASGERIALADTSGTTTAKELLLWPVGPTGTVKTLSLSGKTLKTVGSVKVTNAYALTLGDLDGNSKMDVITLTAAKGKPSVRMLSFRRQGIVTSKTIALSVKGVNLEGATMAVGDFDADGVVNVVVAQPKSTKILVYNYEAGKKTLTQAAAPYVGNQKSKIGYTIQPVDLDGDGRRSILFVPVGKAPTLTIMKLQGGKFQTERSLQPAGKTFKGSFSVTDASLK